MNDNMVEIISIIYDDGDRYGLSEACSEIRHDRNRADTFGRLGYYLNGYNLENPDIRNQFFEFLRNCPISRSVSIDARFLDDEEILDVLRNALDLREVRIINDGYVLTDDVLSRFSDNVVVVCDEVSEDFSEQNRSRVYTQHGLFRKEINYVEDDLVSAYFITHDLTDGELDYLVNTINNDNSADYCQISFRVYNPARYKELVTRLHDSGLREDVRINFLGNPLYDRSEAYVGLRDISNNPINVTYDTCSDMINFYTEEPYTVSNMYHSELEGGGKANLDSYTEMLNVLEQQETHIRNQGYTPLEVAIYAYRFLQRNYAYDPDMSATDSVDALTNRQLDIVAGNSTMVCEGYATLYSALMRRCGIPMFRYSTDKHVRNIGRIVDDKYGVDMIGVVDPTFDGSHILADGSFDESRKFTHFMFSPREAIYFDPYVTIATSLVLDYEACGSEYLSLISGDLYEHDLSLNYAADGYAMTMLERMGIQLPEPLTFEDYRGLVADLNSTTIFNPISSDAFLDAYQTVLRNEESELSEYDVISRGRDALLSMIDRLYANEGLTPFVLVNRAGDPYDLPAMLYPAENTLDISNFNRPVEENSILEERNVEEENVVVDVSTGEEENQSDENIVVANDRDVAVEGGAGSSSTDEEYVEATIENGEVGNNVGVSDTVDEGMDDVDVNSDEYIPGTRIRKPRWRGDYETDEEYVAYLAEYYGRYFPQAAAETREDNTTYRLRRNEIIQDLPIHSRQESRFSGLMSEQEIVESQNKIR